ncbi:hypothetical protein CWC48_23240 [Pseudomonas sp. S10E 269]|nr:hypothetical protein CWC49_03690 [Pseudomonas sp. S09F 262]PJK41923.1 hypothetical protein CWC48_23240 [Pseudomonas sp. S10E 269]
MLMSFLGVRLGDQVGRTLRSYVSSRALHNQGPAGEHAIKIGRALAAAPHDRAMIDPYEPDA